MPATRSAVRKPRSSSQIRCLHSSRPDGLPWRKGWQPPRIKIARSAVAVPSGLPDDEYEDAIIACETALKLIEKQEQPDDQLKADLEASLRKFKRVAGKQ